eukprot:4307372-Prymnesium_polylepis.2
MVPATAAKGRGGAARQRWGGPGSKGAGRGGSGCGVGTEVSAAYGRTRRGRHGLGMVGTVDLTRLPDRFARVFKERPRASFSGSRSSAPPSSKYLPHVACTSAEAASSEISAEVAALRCST